MNQVLSLWRSPLDKVAVAEAQSLRDRQPRCLILFNTPFNPMTVYNFGSYAGVPGGGTASANTGYLNDMFGAMASANPIGGLAFIPQSQFEVEASADGITVSDQCNVIGSGPGGVSTSLPTPPSFYHFNIMTDGIFFNCNNTSYTSGGQYFRSLAFQWSNPMVASDTCIYAGTWNCRAIDCNFIDCPTAFWAAGLQSGLITPTISYGENATVADVVAVYLEGNQSFVLGPGEFRQKNTPHAGGPNLCSGIALGGGSTNPITEHALITEVHLYYWSYGIDYNRNYGAFGTQITNVEGDIYRICVRMQPFDSSGIIFGEKFTSCLFRKTNDSTDGQAIILIDTNGGDTNNINDIEFLDCTVYSDTMHPQVGQYCYQITSGSNIRIIGGTASGAGLSTGQSAGIAITPPFSGTAMPGRITILGVDLSSQYPLADNAATVSQQYAVLISATLSDAVTIDSCKMSGYESIGNPVSVTGDAGNYLSIRNCPGYNDQNTLLNGSVAPRSPLSASMCSPTRYFGPSLIVYQAAAPVTLSLFGVNIIAASGMYFLPSPYDTISFSSAPTFFNWIGK